MKRAALLCVMLGIASVAAGAEESPGLLTMSVFPPGEERCLAQDFSPKTKGQLTSLMIYRLMRPNLSYEYLDADHETQVKRDKGYTYSLPAQVIARYNDHKGDYVQSVSCNDDEGGIRCGVDCDGGGFKALMKDGKFTMTMWDWGMVVRGGCGDEDETSRMLVNKDFPAPPALTGRPVEACVEADRQSALSFSREVVSLRERIETKGWTCLRRSYDAAHLKKNPKQQVKSIAVKLALQKKSSEDGGIDVSLAAVAEVKLRSGKSARKALDCYAGQYEFSCGPDFRLKRRSDKDALLISREYQDAPLEMLGLKIGAGDDVFRLDASASSECKAE